MLTKTIEIRGSETNLHDLLSLVRGGAEVVLTEGSTPFARLVPMGVPTAPRTPGLHRGLIWTSEDFDDPLPEGFWTETT